MFKTIIKNCCLISVFLITGCNGASTDSSQESSIEKQLTESTSFEDTKKLLLDYLTEDNVEEVNKLAINYGIIKPMFFTQVITDLTDSVEYGYTYGYILNQNRGNEAYRDALNNIYFRKAIFALFTHYNYALTSTMKSAIEKMPSNFLPTYKSSRSSKEIMIDEGIEEAKKCYQKAKETGLNDDHIELYLWFKGFNKDEKQRYTLLKSMFSEVFGLSVSFTFKRSESELDYSTLDTSNILETYVPFYNEITLDYYDMYTTLQSILSDFVYSKNNAAFKTSYENMNDLYNNRLVDYDKESIDRYFN